MRLLAAVICIALAWAGAAVAADYKPVRCAAAKAYEGPPPHAPPAPADLQAAGALSGDFDPATQARLQAALGRAMAATGARAMTVSVARPGQAAWSATRGPEAPRFWWASAGKMVTAVLVLQLADEGRLSLDDPISKYVAGVPNGGAITLEMLLAHTSGLYSANEDPEARANPRGRTLAEDLAILRRHGAMFCPGQAWRYSNTGYALLGAVIEAVEGAPYAEVARRRVIDRLGPTGLRMLTPDDAIVDLAPLAPSDPAEPRMHPAWAGPAGALAGDAAGMNRLLQAVLSSELVKPETTARQFARLYPAFDPGTFYGLGIMLYEPPGAGFTWLGHGGGAPGAKAIAVWSPADRALVSVALTGDGSAPATANLLLKALRP